MRKYNINANLVRAIEHLYNNAIRAGQMNGSVGEWFRITVGDRRMSFSPTLFNIILEKNMSDALEEHDGKVSIGGRTITTCGLPKILTLLLKKSKDFRP